MIASILTAFIILECFSSVYYNRTQTMECVDGCTDYTWKPNSFYSDCTEGFGYGRINNEGYCNFEDYYPGDEINVLMIGSSFFQSIQLPMRDTAYAILSRSMPDKRVYNIGMSGHDFATCCGNFQAAVEKYRPTDYIILELNRGVFLDRLAAFNRGELKEMYSPSGGLMSLAMHSSFLRLMYYQLSSYTESNSELDRLLGFAKKIKSFFASKDIQPVRLAAAPVAQAVPMESVQSSPSDSQSSEYDIIFTALSRAKYTADSVGAKLIILYHAGELVGPYRNVEIYDLVKDSVFSDVCDELGIHLVNMCDTWQRVFDEDYTVVYGFSNTLSGEGHLNRRGQELVAEALLEAMEVSGK